MRRAGWYLQFVFGFAIVLIYALVGAAIFYALGTPARTRTHTRVPGAMTTLTASAQSRPNLGRTVTPCGLSPSRSPPVRRRARVPCAASCLTGLAGAVGYGYYVPTTFESRAFWIVFTLLGIVIAALPLSAVAELMLNNEKSVLRVMRDSCRRRCCAGRCQRTRRVHRRGSRTLPPASAIAIAAAPSPLLPVGAAGKSVRVADLQATLLHDDSAL